MVKTLLLLLLSSSIYANSLAEITGEKTLWNAIAKYNNLDAKLMTKIQFRELVTIYAKTVGHEYYCNKNNGDNNTLILNAIIKPEQAEEQTFNYPRDTLRAMRALNGVRTCSIYLE